MDITNLNSFLRLGYFLKYENPRYKYNYLLNESKFDDLTEHELIKFGSNVFLKIIESNFRKDSRHVIPLSGGIDSRALLLALLRFTTADNISTYTFGTPRTLDYDIGKKVAKKYGVMHKQFPLNNQNYSIKELVDISCRIDHQTVLFHHQPVWVTDSLFGGHLIWSGFNGGTFTDDYVEKFNSISIKEAKDNFIKKNTFVKSYNLVSNSNDSINNLIEIPTEKDECISIDMIVDANNRQLKYIEPHVLIQGYKYATPFMNKEWNEFFLSIDKKYRTNQYLYLKILENIFPDFFLIPDKKNNGISRKASNKLKLLQRLNLLNKQFVNRLVPWFPRYDVNYVDFNSKLRVNNYLSQVVYENLQDLKQRKVIEWINIDNLWKAHITKKANCADVIITLASLEIHLKAGKII